MSGTEETYHHGDLPHALLTSVDELVRERDPARLTLREVARRVGVSHAAPAHHFGDKAGLLTAYAIEGLEALRRALTAARDAETEPGSRLLAIGLAYVRFASEERGHFAVMFRPEHLNADDPTYREARQAAFEVLLEAVRDVRSDLEPGSADVLFAATGAWSIVHGFATLWLDSDLAQLVAADSAVEGAEAALTQFGATLFAAAGLG